MSKNKTWSFLKAGDVVDIIAPASHSPVHKLEKGCEWIRSLGLIPRVPEDLLDPQIFFSAPLETQLRHLTSALHSDSKAIWCLRGGYGSMRLVPHLKKMKPTTPKAFLGFSDITALHLFLNQEWKWPTLHSRVLSQMDPQYGESPDRRELVNLLFGRSPGVILTGLIPMNAAALNESVVSGEITGGNLRIVQTSLGLPWQCRTKNKIVFLEDVDERGYSIDRMLEQLIGAGLLDQHPRAVVFGDFTGSKEKDGKDHSLFALESFARRVHYPVFRGVPAGHGTELNHTIPFNTRATLITGKEGILSIQSGGA